MWHGMHYAARQQFSSSRWFLKTLCTYRWHLGIARLNFHIVVNSDNRLGPCPGKLTLFPEYNAERNSTETATSAQHCDRTGCQQLANLRTGYAAVQLTSVKFCPGWGRGLSTDIIGYREIKLIDCSCFDDVVCTEAVGSLQ